MAIGLAEAGADIVGVDYVVMPDTQATIEALGRRFHRYRFEPDLDPSRWPSKRWSKKP
ncbi:MAG: hypothetical protein MZU97_26145 [Bacillus subtilis]|nr:hypothetical protein [Bacillus subtilis]